MIKNTRSLGPDNLCDGGKMKKFFIIKSCDKYFPKSCFQHFSALRTENPILVLFNLEGFLKFKVHFVALFNKKISTKSIVVVCGRCVSGQAKRCLLSFFIRHKDSLVQESDGHKYNW